MNRVNSMRGRGEDGDATREGAEGGEVERKGMGHREEMEELWRGVGEEGARGDAG